MTNVSRRSSVDEIMKRTRLLTWTIVLLAVILVSVAQAATPAPSKDKFKILGIFQHSGYSHFVAFKNLLEELARRGHEVTVISYYPRKSGQELKGYRDVSLYEKPSDIKINILQPDRFQRYFTFVEVFFLRTWAVDHCKRTFSNPGVQRLIRSDEKFDLILTEVFNTDCFLGLVHRFKAPYVGLSSHDLMPWISDRVNNPDNPSYIPNIFSHSSSKMDFTERLINTVGLIFQKIVYEVGFQWPMQAEVEKVFGPGVPPLGEIANNITAILVNTHFTVHGARPHPPNVIEIGGMHIGEAKPLPEDIKRFLDDAHEGALLFSWGSMVKTSSLSKNKLEQILRVLGSIPRKVIWKWEDENLPGKPPNVMTKTWLPQFDIMNHPNVKGYVGHGGNLGLSEGLYTGLPMVIVPMYGDQYYSAAVIAERGAGVMLPLRKLNEETFRDALDRIFNDTSYRENAQALSRAYRDRPASPLETGIWWTEYFARGNGNPFVRSAAADLAWYQYHLLDVCGFLIVVSLASLYVTYRLLRILFGRLIPSSLHDNRKKKD